MQRRQFGGRAAQILAFLTVLLLGTAACNRVDESYLETFDETGTWSTGSDTFSTGEVTGGVYRLTVIENDISRWASVGKNFSDGIYEVEATPVEGPLDNGYGLLFRADPEAGDFYLFKVSADGFVWIGRYRDGAEETTIVGDHWFESPAVQVGLNVTNTLRVVAEAGNMIFYVNEQEVGRVTDTTFSSGDVGVLVQTLGGGGVTVEFDNLSVRPLP
jgi:hypothetical protein